MSVTETKKGDSGISPKALKSGTSQINLLRSEWENHAGFKNPGFTKYVFFSVQD